MGQKLRKVLIIVGLTALFGGAYAEAYPAERVQRLEQRAERRAREPRQHIHQETARRPLDQRDGRRALRRDQYLQDRIEAIVEQAGLTADEKTFVESELAKYDEIRISTWQETRKIYDEMEALGDKATDQQYRESLNKLIQLHSDRHTARQNLTKALLSKLGGKKAYLTYEGMNHYNTRVGRGIRQ